MGDLPPSTSVRLHEVAEQRFLNQVAGATGGNVHGPGRLLDTTKHAERANARRAERTR